MSLELGGKILVGKRDVTVRFNSNKVYQFIDFSSLDGAQISLVIKITIHVCVCVCVYDCNRLEF